MKCPHCNYENSCDEENIYSGLGHFFSMPISLERKNSWDGDIEEAYLFGCPKCCKTFIDKQF